MSSEFYAYVNLHAIGAEYFKTLPAALQAAISNYAEGLFYGFGGSRYYVKHGGSGFGTVPTVWPPANGIWAAGTTWQAPAPPGPLGATDFAQLGTTGVRPLAHNRLGAPTGVQLHNAARDTASPFIYDDNNRTIAVNYSSALTMTDFMAAWKALVASLSGGTAFLWPTAFAGTNAGKLEFAAAALAESSRDKAQLGAIRLMQDSRWRTQFGTSAFVSVLPMCAGGTFWPHQMNKASGTAVMLNASPTVWQRCYRISKVDPSLPSGLNQTTFGTVIQGLAPQSGQLKTGSYNLASSHFPKYVKRWWW